MGKVVIKVRIIPSDTDVSLEKISNEVKKIISEESGIFVREEIVPIGFGIKALDISFAHYEGKFVEEEFIEKIKAIEGVGEAEIIGATLSPV